MTARWDGWETAAAEGRNAEVSAAEWRDVEVRDAEGSLNLTTVRLLSPHLTGANHRDALDAAAHGSRRQVEE